MSARADCRDAGSGLARLVDGLQAGFESSAGRVAGLVAPLARREAGAELQDELRDACLAEASPRQTSRGDPISAAPIRAAAVAAMDVNEGSRVYRTTCLGAGLGRAGGGRGLSFVSTKGLSFAQEPDRQGGGRPWGTSEQNPEWVAETSVLLLAVGEACQAAIVATVGGVDISMVGAGKQSCQLAPGSVVWVGDEANPGLVVSGASLEEHCGDEAVKGHLGSVLGGQVVKQNEAMRCGLTGWSDIDVMVACIGVFEPRQVSKKLRWCPGTVEHLAGGLVSDTDIEEVTVHDADLSFDSGCGSVHRVGLPFVVVGSSGHSNGGGSCWPPCAQSGLGFMSAPSTIGAHAETGCGATAAIAALDASAQAVKAGHGAALDSGQGGLWTRLAQSRPERTRYCRTWTHRQ